MTAVQAADLSACPYGEQHAWISHHVPGHLLYWVRTCMLCSAIDWDDIDREVRKIMSEAPDQATATDGISVDKSGPGTERAPYSVDVPLPEPQPEAEAAPPVTGPTAAGTATSPAGGSAQRVNPLVRIGDDVFLHVEHVAQFVERFAREHPGLDRIFVQGLLGGLRELVASGTAAQVGVAVVGALDEKSDKTGEKG
jgi:hypothetical protein